MTSYQEQNAKAEQIGSAIAIGCIGLPIMLLLLIFLVVALMG